MPNHEIPDTNPAAPKRFRLPLALRVLLGVGIGILLGVTFGTRAWFFGLHNEDLGQMGLLVIKLLKTLASPLILFAILDAFAKTKISARRGGKLILICLLNVSVAMLIGLTLINTFKPGLRWRGHLDQIMGQVKQHSAAIAAPNAPPVEATLNPLKNVAGYVPESLLDPLLKNNVISIVLMAVLAGAAFRHIKERNREEDRVPIQTLERFVSAVYALLVQMLEWVVLAVPFAVLGVVAKVVGASGLAVFRDLWVFLVFTLLGLAIHSLLYYPLAAWVIGKKSPRVYLGVGADAILTGLSTNSSLATVPVTLRCLRKMGVSESSARLAACIGTNLNNDGITLYEATAALFLAQAVGFNLAIGQQMVVVLAAIMAGAGIAGIPEAGLIMLPLVLGAAGLPENLILAALPILVPVDWIIARCRSGVNVMSDMLVAIQLDGGKPEKYTETEDEK